MTDKDWKRLGRLLMERRVELGFPKRQPWATRELGLKNDRIQSDLEKARRTNYDAATLALAEQQYQWAPGSIDRVLEGGDPVPAGPAEQPVGLRSIDFRVPLDDPPTGGEIEVMAHLLTRTMHFARTAASLAPQFAGDAKRLSEDAAVLFARVVTHRRERYGLSEPTIADLDPRDRRAFEALVGGPEWTPDLDRRDQAAVDEVALEEEQAANRERHEPDVTDGEQEDRRGQVS